MKGVFLRGLMAIVAFGLIATVSMAQAPGPLGGKVTLRGRGGPGNGNPLGPGGDAKVLEVIGLTADQKQQVDSLKKQVFGDFLQKREALAGDRKALADEVRQRLRTYNEGLQNILTTDQAAKYRVWTRGRRYLAGTNDNAAIQSLQLDNDLMGKVRELKANEARDAEAALLTNLTDEDKAAAAVQRAHDTYLAYLQTALSNDQWKAYQDAVLHPPAKVKTPKKGQF